MGYKPPLCSGLMMLSVVWYGQPLSLCSGESMMALRVNYGAMGSHLFFRTI